MSDSLITIMELLKEVLEEELKDDITYIRLDKATPQQINYANPNSKNKKPNYSIVKNVDGADPETEFVKIIGTVKSKSAERGLSAEKYLKESLEKYFDSKGQSGVYEVSDPQGSGAEPDIIVKNGQIETAFEVKNTPYGLVDYGQSDLFFNGQDWEITSNNVQLKDSFSRIKDKIPKVQGIPKNKSSISTEERDQLVDHLKAAVEIPKDRIIHYYKVKNRFLYIKSMDSIYCLRENDPLINKGIPYLGRSLTSDPVALFRMKHQGSRAPLDRKYRFKMTQRIRENSLQPGMPLGKALPIIFP